MSRFKLVFFLLFFLERTLITYRITFERMSEHIRSLTAKLFIKVRSLTAESSREEQTQNL